MKIVHLKKKKIPLYKNREYIEKLKEKIIQEHNNKIRQVIIGDYIRVRPRH